MLRGALVVLAFGCAAPLHAKGAPSRPAPVTVISDIDDTIKDTRLWAFGIRHFPPNPGALFASRPITGMPETYRRWERELGCKFFYVSAKPESPANRRKTCQFLCRSNFPTGELVLRARKDFGIFHLLANRTDKYELIKPLIEKAPGRRFILVGDSGEYDPEGYGMLACEFGDRIAAIFIRQATCEPSGSPRYSNAFQHVPLSHWRLFFHPAELASLRLDSSPRPANSAASASSIPRAARAISSSSPTAR